MKLFYRYQPDYGWPPQRLNFTKNYPARVLLIFCSGLYRDRAAKHRLYLVKKAKIPEADFDLLMQTLLDNVELVPFEDLEHEYDRCDGNHGNG